MTNPLALDGDTRLPQRRSVPHPGSRVLRREVIDAPPEVAAVLEIGLGDPPPFAPSRDTNAE